MVEAGLSPYPGYRLTRLLGRGGFGEVWEGVSAEGNRLAFKFIPTRNQSPSVAANEVRFLLALRELKRPNLVELRSVIARPDYLIVVMEMADGNLYHLLTAYQDEAQTHIPPDHLCELLGEAAEALDFLARQRLSGCPTVPTGIQHCDVKPSNLLLFGDRLKVTDFGLCAPQLNLRGSYAFGTPGYAPPELADGKVTQRTDQYSLAASYVELRLGKLPCNTTSVRKPEKPDINWFPDKERLVLARALETQWLRRWPSCTDFMNALKEAVKGSDARTWSGSRRRPVLV